MKEIILIVDDIRSVHNTGSLFRTADALGVSKIMLCGTTPTPLDKYKRPRSDFAKVSLGAEKTVPWEYEVFGLNAVLRAKEEGYYIVAIEQDENAQDYKTVSLEGKQRVAFIVGSEVEGLDGVVLSECDVIAEIPMNGSKESLNVVVAFGVAAYRMLNI